MVVVWLAVACAAGGLVGYAATRALGGGRSSSTAEDAWRRSARTLSVGDRVRVAAATGRGRAVRDARLAPFAAEQAEALLARLDRARQHRSRVLAVLAVAFAGYALAVGWLAVRGHPAAAAVLAVLGIVLAAVVLPADRRRAAALRRAAAENR